jgi:hypothetical protein
MYPSGFKTIDASSDNRYFGQYTDMNWALGIGDKFGVTTDGSLYCTSGTFTGRVEMSGGSIARWTVDGSGLYL